MSETTECVISFIKVEVKDGAKTLLNFIHSIDNLKYIKNRIAEDEEREYLHLYPDEADYDYINYFVEYLKSKNSEKKKVRPTKDERDFYKRNEVALEEVYLYLSLISGEIYSVGPNGKSSFEVSLNDFEIEFSVESYGLKDNVISAKVKGSDTLYKLYLSPEDIAIIDAIKGVEFKSSVTLSRGNKNEPVFELKPGFIPVAVQQLISNFNNKIIKLIEAAKGPASLEFKHQLALLNEAGDVFKDSYNELLIDQKISAISDLNHKDFSNSELTRLIDEMSQKIREMSDFLDVRKREASFVGYLFDNFDPIYVKPARLGQKDLFQDH